MPCARVNVCVCKSERVWVCLRSATLHLLQKNAWCRYANKKAYIHEEYAKKCTLRSYNLRLLNGAHVLEQTRKTHLIVEDSAWHLDEYTVRHIQIYRN